MNAKSLISFVVIGKNEEANLRDCFDSIEAVQSLCSDWEHELIYVDSRSTDGSVAVAKSHPAVKKTFVLSEATNAAIARNVGAAESRGDILCFIDGDMILRAAAYSKVLRMVASNKHAYASGNVIDLEQVGRRENPFVRERYKMSADRLEVTTGGLFIVRRSVWELVGGMRNVFRRSQDIDFGLRLARSGIFLYRVLDIIAVHRTTPYLHRGRFFKDLFAGNFLYLGLLTRKNFFNKYLHRVYCKSYLSSAILLLCFIWSLLQRDYYPIFLYVAAIVGKSLIFPGGTTLRLGLVSVGHKFLIDISFLLGFFFFYPAPLREAYVCVGTSSDAAEVVSE